MLNKTLFFITLIALFTISNVLAQDSYKDNKEDAIQTNDKLHNKSLDKKDKIKAYIKHHLQDSHDFYVTKKIKFPLPIILWDEGLHIFSSFKFHEGNGVVESKGKYYAISHSNGHIYRTDKNGKINYNEKGFATNNKPLNFSITKNVVMVIITGLLMLLIFSGLAKSYSKNKGLPKGPGRFLEPIVLYIRDDIAIPNIGEKHYKKYMPYLLTTFFFVWFLNLFGLTPLGVNVTNNITVTFTLAILTYLITTFTAKKSYWKHIFWMPGVPTPMKFLLAPIELLGTIIKPFSLMIRLYANMTAGHVIIMSIIALIFLTENWIGRSLSFGLAFALMLLELLVAALQAYIFTMLSALYFGSAVEEHEHH